MQTNTGASTPLWQHHMIDIESDGTLHQDQQTEVCIVGAGISGLTTAYLLAKVDKQVIVLERNAIGAGMSSRTTAHLMCALDDRFYKLAQLHGAEAAQMASQSHQAAIDMIGYIVETENIDCEFERLDGYLFTDKQGSTEELKQEYEAASDAGCTVYMLERAPILHFETGPALKFAHQAQFHPVKYLAGLASAIRKLGGKIFSNTDVAEVFQVKSQTFVQTRNGAAVTADNVVIATNAPINNRFEIPLKQAGYMTYVVGARIPRDSVTKALYWDNLEKYHYVRVAELPYASQEEQILLIGGEDHKVGQANDASERYTALTTWALERFPMIRSFDYHWSGEVMEPIDGLAYIGNNPHDSKNIYIATGDSGMGMTHGTLAGILIRDQILGNINPWSGLYDPSRKPLTALGHMARESLNTNLQYTDWLTSSEVVSVDDIPVNEGAVIRQGFKKIAVYRDEDNTLHECSAMCTHLAGVVRWNSAEKTWDCPCHGSRFDAYGHVIQGPANQDLPSLSVEETT